MESDYERYQQEHYDLFGHWPLPALDGSGRCTHELHDRIHARIDAPGVDVVLPFDSRSVIDDDSEVAVVSREKYQEAVGRIRAELRSWDEEDAFATREHRLLF